MEPFKQSRKAALHFIILLGFVSLFADITYEGARSITGPYLSLLGASGAAVGLIVGTGELVGYGLRAVFGYICDKTRGYWPLTIIGYSVNLLAVPFLALATNWQWAAFFILLERFGKAIRTPARDTMLSYATKETGRGWGFGLHEALDQVGAIIGPLLIGVLLFFSGKLSPRLCSSDYSRALSSFHSDERALFVPLPTRYGRTKANLSNRRVNQIVLDLSSCYWIDCRRLC